MYMLHDLAELSKFNKTVHCRHSWLVFIYDQVTPILGMQKLNVLVI